MVGKLPKKTRNGETRVCGSKFFGHMVIIQKILVDHCLGKKYEYSRVLKKTLFITCSHEQEELSSGSHTLYGRQTCPIISCSL